MMFEAIESGLATEDITLKTACGALGVSRSGYYYRQDQPVQQTADDGRLMRLRDEIQKIAVEFSRYGYRRVTKELHRRGFSVNAKVTLKLMREDNLLCLRHGFKPRTTDSDHGLKVFPNLIKGLVVTGLNQVWVSDITYIQLLTEYVYLAVILDVFSRRCIGWELGRRIDTELALNALNRALRDRWTEEITGLIHHSDQGVQYASKDYVDCLKDHKIRISMSRKGNPYDNAFAESFIKTLKWEEVYLTEYQTFHQAGEDISNFIEEVYNKKRLHSSIGYKPPIEFEMEVNSSRSLA